MRDVTVHLFLAAGLIAVIPTVVAGQSLPDRPGGSRPVQLSKPRIAPLPEAKWTNEHKERIAKFLPPGARRAPLSLE